MRKTPMTEISEKIDSLLPNIGDTKDDVDEALKTCAEEYISSSSYNRISKDDALDKLEVNLGNAAIGTVVWIGKLESQGEMEEAEKMKEMQNHIVKAIKILHEMMK